MSDPFVPREPAPYAWAGATDDTYGTTDPWREEPEERPADGVPPDGSTGPLVPDLAVPVPAAPLDGARQSGGPSGTSGTSGTSTPPHGPRMSFGDVTSQTLAILTSAQTHADALRAEMQAQAEATAAECTRLRLEADELRERAASLHADSVAALEQAKARLVEAQEDADQLHVDAAEQSALVTAAAARTVEEAISQAREEAAQLLSAAQAESQQLLDAARSDYDTAMAAWAELQRAQVDALEERIRDADAERLLLTSQTQAQVSSLRQQAEAEVACLREEARSEAQVWRDDARATLESHQQRAHQILDEGQQRVAELTAVAQTQADETVAAADSHMKWARATMQEMLDGAREEVARKTAVSHRERQETTRDHRTWVQGVLAQAAHKAETTVADALAESERLRSQAQAVLQSAREDAQRTSDRAQQESARVVTDAELNAQAAVERAERRLAEAEHGARIIRERTGAEVERLQRDCHEQRRATRAELVETITAARAEADELRAQARKTLEDARHEATVLASRRDDIASQLGYLSGVIEALAVTERPEGTLEGLEAELAASRAAAASASSTTVHGEEDVASQAPVEAEVDPGTVDTQRWSVALEPGEPVPDSLAAGSFEPAEVPGLSADADLPRLDPPTGALQTSSILDDPWFSLASGAPSPTPEEGSDQLLDLRHLGDDPPGVEAEFHWGSFEDGHVAPALQPTDPTH